MKEIDDIDALIDESLPPPKTLKATSMKRWLKQYKISSRSSTVTGAFVAALLPYDTYEQKTVQDAMDALNQKNYDRLNCVYCGEHATTWDHLTCLVQARKAHGPGHRIRNLVPCCAACNSAKGGTPYENWIKGYPHPTKGLVSPAKRVVGDRDDLVSMLKKYHSQCPEPTAGDVELGLKLMVLRDAVNEILKQVDKLVKDTRKLN